MKTPYCIAIGISAVVLFGCGGGMAASGSKPTTAASTNYAATYPAQFNKMFIQTCRRSLAQSNYKIPVKTQQNYCACSSAYVQKHHPYQEYARHERGLIAGNKADQRWFAKVADKALSVCYVK